jgi:hypothetical protein
MQRLSQGCNDVMRLEDVVAKGKVEQTQLAQQCLDLEGQVCIGFSGFRVYTCKREAEQHECVNSWAKHTRAHSHTIGGETEQSQQRARPLVGGEQRVARVPRRPEPHAQERSDGAGATAAVEQHRDAGPTRTRAQVSVRVGADAAHVAGGLLMCGLGVEG